MRFLHPGRRAVAAGLALLAAAGIAGAAAGVAAASSTGTDSTASAALDASLAATGGHTHTGARAVRAALVRLLVRDTAKQTGQSRAAVLQDLRAGKTLDQVAGAKAGTVTSDVLALVRARLGRAVTAHRITPAQEQARLTAVTTAVSHLMNTTA